MRPIGREVGKLVERCVHLALERVEKPVPRALTDQRRVGSHERKGRTRQRRDVARSRREVLLELAKPAEPSDEYLDAEARRCVAADRDSDAGFTAACRAHELQPLHHCIPSARQTVQPAWGT